MKKINFNQSQILNLVQKMLYKNSLHYVLYLNFVNYCSKTFIINKVLYLLLNYKKQKFLAKSLIYNIHIKNMYKSTFIYEINNTSNLDIFIKKKSVVVFCKMILIFYLNLISNKTKINLPNILIKSNYTFFFFFPSTCVSILLKAKKIFFSLRKCTIQNSKFLLLNNLFIFDTKICKLLNEFFFSNLFFFINSFEHFDLIYLYKVILLKNWKSFLFFVYKKLIFTEYLQLVNYLLSYLIITTKEKYFRKKIDNISKVLIQLTKIYFLINKKNLLKFSTVSYLFYKILKKIYYFF